MLRGRPRVRIVSFADAERAGDDGRARRGRLESDPGGLDKPSSSTSGQALIGEGVFVEARLERAGRGQGGRRGRRPGIAKRTPERKSPHQTVRAETTIEEVEETARMLPGLLVRCNINFRANVVHIRHRPEDPHPD